LINTGKHHITDFSSAGGTGLFDPYLVILTFNLIYFISVTAMIIGIW